MKSINETFSRILSAVVLLPLYLFCLYTEGFWNIPILIISVLVSISVLYEFYQIAILKFKSHVFVPYGIICAIVVNVLFYFYAFSKVLGFSSQFSNLDVRIFFAVSMLLICFIVVFQVFRRPIEGAIVSLSVTVFGIIYLVLSFAHIIFMKALPDGFFYILALHAIVMVNDSAAYFGGVFFGKHKAGFKVSPNKSWEGYFSGILFSIISMIVLNNIYIVFWDKNLFTVLEAGFLGAFLSLAGNVGDLIESAIKRDGGVKDSGRLIPGHGGMWDVFDALIFTIPLFYYYLKIRAL